jgi:rhodanese-related sulfurtransferase
VSRLLGLGAEVVDVRPHEEFLRGHIRGSINIPGSELPVRAPHELAGGHVVLVYCAYCADCSSVRAAEGISTNCSFATKLLGEAGYKDVRVIGGNLQDLRGAGVRVVGSTQELR